MLSVIAAQNRNSPAQVVQKCARRLIDGTLYYYYYYYYYYESNPIPYCRRVKIL